MLSSDLAVPFSHNISSLPAPSLCAHLLELAVLDDAALIGVNLVEQFLGLRLRQFSLGDDLGGFLYGPHHSLLSRNEIK